MSLPNWSELEDSNRAATAIKGASLTIGSGAIRLILSILSAIILGRLLAPEDFGLMGMILPLIGLISLFADGGIGFYTLQTKRMTHQKLSQLFWLAAAVATLLTLVFCAVTPLIALFYDEPRLQNLALLVSFSFILTIFTNQHNALVKRYFRNELYSVSEVFAAISSFTVSVIIALNGFGYWALASIPLTRHAIHAATIWLLTKWTPSFTLPSRRQSYTALDFGWHMSFSIGMGFIAKNIDKVLVGWKFGAEALGYYTMAYSIMMLPFLQVSTPIGGTVIPYLKTYRKNSTEFNIELGKIQYLLSMCIVPPMLWAAFFSEELLVTVLGDKWLNSAEIFSVLSLSAICITQTLPLGWAITSIGKPKLLTKWSLFFVPLTIFSYLAGLKFGVIGVAYSLLAANLIQLITLPFFAAKHTIISLNHYINSILRSLGASAIIFLMVFGMTQISAADLSMLILTFILMILITLPISWAFNKKTVSPILTHIKNRNK